MAGPRALVFGSLLGIAMWLAIGCAIHAKADHMACNHPALSWPRTVSIANDAPNPAAWRSALVEWNGLGTRAQFREVPYGTESDVYILSSYYWSNGQTWVAIPCNRTDSIVYAGNDVDLNYWAAHEMGHTLGLADHITAFIGSANYLSAKYCPDPYDGVMSYCTPRSRWWNPLDMAMLWYWF